MPRESAPRPILVNTWYPVREIEHVAAMLQSEYLSIETDDPRLARFASQLASYERLVVSDEVMDKPPAKLSALQRGLLDGFWEMPTASRRDVPPAAGTFPIVIYHAGAGSSFEDNSVLFEFLASHGYVVVSSSFHDATGKSFNIDAREGSLRDIEFLIAFASRLSYADWNHIGVGGHSRGAQAALVFCAQNDCAVDALVSLDSADPYQGIATLGPDCLTEPVLKKNVKNARCPMLFAARPEAAFEFTDALEYAERYYLTVKYLEHNDFISQGVLRRFLESRAKPDDPTIREKLERVRAGYTAVCEYVLTFLDAYLKENSRQRARLKKASAGNRQGGTESQLDHVRRRISAAGISRPAGRGTNASADPSVPGRPRHGCDRGPLETLP